ncbi:unnamed protein product [Dicrocoelium dendriticum]|nr:unnamed protein product [Dicrocoelium dendriticum]
MRIMITSPSAQLKLHSFLLLADGHKSEASCKLEDFPSLTQSRPISFGLSSSQRTCTSFKFVDKIQDTFDGSPLSTRRRRTKRNHKRMLDANSPAALDGYGDAFTNNRGAELQSKCNSTDSVW